MSQDDFYISFTVPVIIENYAYTLPDSYGTNGYVLSTDGAGGLSWISGSVDWSNVTNTPKIT
jgi:hypothetical protein